MLPCSLCQREVLDVFLNYHSFGLSLRPTLNRHTSQSSRWRLNKHATIATAVQQVYRQEGLVPRGEPSKSLHKQDESENRRLDQSQGRHKNSDLDKELRYLNDPLKLAQHVVRLLDQDKALEAVEIVRAASRKMMCTVSWNHIIDDAMNRGKVTAAVKTYNEMKKRAQPPDSHTYTTLLRGLAATKYPQNQSRALSIYSSMFAEKSTVNPTIIHTNAMLKVCAYQGDIDCLFGLAAKLPTRGRGAPDNWTYTTILNAIRNQLWLLLQENSENAIEQRERKRQEALLQGRRIWGDIVERWRSGEVSVDEQLVCSMGRLLLLGSRPEDFDDVLSLVEQAMGIPRQIPRIGHPDRVTHHKPVGAIFLEEKGEDTSTCDTDRGEHSHNIVSSVPSTVDSLAYSQTPGSEFDSSPASYRSFAKPSRNTLSLILDACVHMRLSTVANTYRKILTSPDGEYRIRPDIDNLHMYLRILRQSRSSRNAVAMVESMITDPPLGESVQVKTFRIAMSCCVRDRANPAILGHATKLLRMMTNTLEEPDFKVSEMFVEIIAQKEIPWRDTLEGLREMEKIIGNFRSLIAYGSLSSTTPESISGEIATRKEAATYNAEADLDDYTGASKPRKLGSIRSSKYHSRREITDASRQMVNAFATRMISAYDRLLNNAREGMSSWEKRECQENKYRLQAWVSRDANRRKRDAFDGKKYSYETVVEPKNGDVRR